MSIHKSLNIQGTLNTERSVWTRRERIEKLKEEGRWDEGSDSPFGLPKVRTRFKVLGKKSTRGHPSTQEVLQLPKSLG